MYLTEKEIKEIYEHWKGKELNLEEMKDMYILKIPDDAILYKIDIEFRRGGDYRESGIIKMEYYKQLEAHYQNKTIGLGEVLGKHSNVQCDLSEIRIFKDKDTIREYLKEEGYDKFCYDGNERVNDFLQNVDCGFHYDEPIEEKCEVCLKAGVWEKDEKPAKKTRKPRSVAKKI